MRIQVNDTELFVDVDGAQFAVGDQGLTERPTVVVLHGGPGFDQGYLRPGIGPLRDLAQLVFVDLRGQGRSGRPPVETCTLEQMDDDVAELCACLGVERPVVLGHSAGGFVALHLALRHPQVAGGLILCATAPTLAPMPDDDPSPSLAERASAEAVRTAGRLFGGDFSEQTMEAFERTVLPYYAGPTHQEVPTALMALSAFNGDVAANFFGKLAAGYDVRGRLAEIAVPTSVIVGSYDWICPPVASRVLADGIPEAVLVEPDAGHFAFAEEPTAFRAAVDALLMRHLGGRADPLSTVASTSMTLPFAVMAVLTLVPTILMVRRM